MVRYFIKSKLLNKIKFIMLILWGLMMLLGITLDNNYKRYDEVHIVHLYFKIIDFTPKFKHLIFENNLGEQDAKTMTSYSDNLSNFYNHRYLNFFFLEIFLKDKFNFQSINHHMQTVHEEMTKKNYDKYLDQNTKCSLLLNNTNEIVTDSSGKKNILIMLSNTDDGVKLCKKRFLKSIIKTFKININNLELEKNKHYLSFLKKNKDLLNNYSTKEINNLFYDNVKEYNYYMNLAINEIQKAFNIFEVEKKIEKKIFIFNNKFFIFFLFFPIYLFLLYSYVPKKYKIK